MHQQQEEQAMRLGLLTILCMTAANAASHEPAEVHASGPDFIISSRPHVIEGGDKRLGIRFHAIERGEVVTIDTQIGQDRCVHAEIDYGNSHLVVHSFSGVDGSPISIDVMDVTRFQYLLKNISQSVDTGTRISDALISFVDLMATAPVENAVDIK